MKIYLAGYISNKNVNECMEWRKKIAEHYNKKAKWQGVMCFLDPFNGEITSGITNDGLKCSIPGKALVHRDYKSVSIADLIIANLDISGKRPLTGTIFELAWAWEMKKPVIVISKKEMYVEHPFIKDTASIIVKDVDKLLEKRYIEYIYKGLVNAEY